MADDRVIEHLGDVPGMAQSSIERVAQGGHRDTEEETEDQRGEVLRSGFGELGPAGTVATVLTCSGVETVERFFSLVSVSTVCSC